MKIGIIGTTSYIERMKKHRDRLIFKKHDARIPAFDYHPELDELGVCKFNLELIQWADQLHIFWDQRSTGTIFDFGMCFALNKPIKLIYLEPKTFRGVMEKYEALFD